MLQPFGWLKRLFASIDAKQDNVIQIFTPQAVEGRGAGTRLALAGATMVGLVAAGSVAVGSLVILLLAVGVIYYLVTEVLGIRLDVDPAAFMAQARQYAQTQRN